ncbi:GNAT family N-acetyltransferase [Leifsonia sp. WHRI 6310E]|uniref:GNAT family N-acetyltransferase n=1 Tax=Leifsonia sp. WHRI 6310E TaxID=3162562 RepID=UPI0035A9A8CC
MRTDRLVLRASEEQDRPTFLDLLSSADVYAFLGGARSRDELDAAMPMLPGSRPGAFVVTLGAAMIGIVTIDRREQPRPGHLTAGAEEPELGYLFLPELWGRGYATEACRAVLDWTETALPGEPVVLCTQSSNAASLRVAAKLGFTERERFEEFGAEQWFGVRVPGLTPRPPGVAPGESDLVEAEGAPSRPHRQGDCTDLPTGVHGESRGSQHRTPLR